MPQKSGQFEKGKKDAEKDINDGKLLIKANYISRRSTSRLKEKFGITVDHIISSEQEVVEYVEGYNSVLKDEIKKRFGDDSLKEINLSSFINHPPVIHSIVIEKRKS